MSDIVFDLIKSFTQTERRYFKIHSSLGFSRDDKSYMQLFNLISKQKEYDEEIVKNKFNHKFFAQQKRNLLKKILESLRIYHKGSSISSLIDASLFDFRILISKSFFKQARKALQRAELLAINYDHFADLIRVKQAETELFIAEGNPSQLASHIEKLRHQLPVLIRKIDNKLAFEKEYLLFIKWNQETEIVRSEKEAGKISSSINFNLLKKETNALSDTAKLQFFYINALYNFLLGDFNKSLSYFEKQVRCYRLNKFIAAEQYQNFAKALANAALLSSKLGNNKNFDKYYNLLESMHSNDRIVSLKISYWNYLVKLNWFASQNRFDESLQWITKNQKEIQMLEQKMENSDTMVNERMYVLFDTLLVYMCTGEIKKANRVINNYLNSSDAALKTDAYCMVRLLSLFIQLELDQLDLLEYNLKSVKRFLKEKKRMFEFEKLSLTFIQNMLKTANMSERKKKWEDYNNSLLVLQNNLFEKNALIYFNMLMWVRKKINETN